MIGKITAPRGERVAGLIYYLFGPGRREEHTDPHIVAGWRHPAELEPPLRPDGRRDFRRLLGLLNQPHAAMGSWGLARPVWHCSMRAAPGDEMLSDDEWAQIACDVMDRTRRGLGEAPRLTLRRQVSTAAAAASTEEEFFARLRQTGVLVRARRSTRDPGAHAGR